MPDLPTLLVLPSNLSRKERFAVLFVYAITNINILQSRPIMTDRK